MTPIYFGQEEDELKDKISKELNLDQVPELNFKQTETDQHFTIKKTLASKNEHSGDSKDQ